ncbi:MAG TPA: ABC transporter permease [Vicinamibacterales bacterium]|nr:ABC transporter permease [Vicinamibacterales bacterium]
METFWRDVRYGVRLWRKTPGFTSIVVLTLAFGIGANTAVFSVINTLFLHPLPVDRPGELVAVRTVDASTRSTEALPISYPNLRDISDTNLVFESVAGHSAPTTLTLLESNTPRRLFGELVTGNYFTTLGVRPVRGRFFLTEEDASPGTAPVLVLAYSAWQARFGAAEDVVGRLLRINDVVFTVIGIAPEGFRGVNAVFGPDVWIPSMMADVVLPAQMKDSLRNRSALSFRGIARLKPGVSPTQAGANLTTIAATLEREHPDDNRGRGLAVDPLTRAALIAPGRMSATTISLVLLAIPGLMLLIACSNVASLLLSRAASRRQEIAVRLAIGADRQRLLRQLLTEMALLACVAGTAGFALAYGGVHLLWSLRPADVTPNLIDVEVDLGVLLFAVVVSLVTAPLFGLAPAWQSMRTDVVRSLSDTGRGVGRTRRGVTIGGVLTAGQVALSLIALVTAGLLLRSLQQAYRLDPGFETHRLAIALIGPGQAGYSRARSEQFYTDVRARLAAMPGVVSATWATQLPLFARPSRSVVVEGRELRERANDIITIVNAIDVEYFATTGIAMTRGRDFLASDREGSRPVSIVNEALAARVWPGLDPIGRRLRLSGDNVVREVVGVAETATYESLGEPAQACLYLPLRQQFSDAAVLYVRTEGDPASVLSTVQRAVREIDTRIDVSDVRTIETVISQSLFGATAGVGLLTLFGLISLALSALGLYGSMVHGMTRRRREIGVRMALGANPRGVAALMLRQGLVPVAAGIALGAVAALGIGLALSSVLFGVGPADPLSLAGASATLAVAATAACYVPARRASRADPLIALREN